MKKKIAANEKTNEFMGLYQWESTQAANGYPDSFIFKMMRMRSAPGTLSYEVIPDTVLSQYIREHQRTQHLVDVLE